MKLRVIYKLYEYSYIIIYGVFLIYLLLYAFWLKDISKYYTYLMIFLSGILLGYIIADKAHRYLKKHYNDSLKQK